MIKTRPTPTQVNGLPARPQKPCFFTLAESLQDCPIY
jgi:hypothetical protein